jgi:hypothetical protein
LKNERRWLGTRFLYENQPLRSLSIGNAFEDAMVCRSLWIEMWYAARGKVLIDLPAGGLRDV